MTFEILNQNTNAWVDVTDMVAFQGFKWQRNDVEAPNSGRTLDALMHRSRVATKIRLDITCRPLRLAEASTVLQLIYPEYVQVRYTDPQEGTVVERTMYSNNNPASFCIKKPDGTEWWDGITFPLIQQ